MLSTILGFGVFKGWGVTTVLVSRPGAWCVESGIGEVKMNRQNLISRRELIPAQIARPGFIARHPKFGASLERGMATAEYAVGILAAVALALVLVKVFKADGFLNSIMSLVTSIFDKILGWLP
jgi:hypothetical protein